MEPSSTAAASSSFSLAYWHTLLKEKLVGYPPFLPDIFLALPLGLILGFLLKSLGRYLVIGLLVTAAALWIADYFDLLTINHGQIESLVGLQPFTSFSEFSSFVGTLIREHVAGFIAFVIAFLLGWRLGI